MAALQKIPKSKSELQRIELVPLADYDSKAKSFLPKLLELGIKPSKILSFRAYYVEKNPELIAKEILWDPIIDTYKINSSHCVANDFIIEIRYKPGITDNEAKTLNSQIKLLKIDSDSKSAYGYIISGINENSAKAISKLIGNSLIHEIIVVQGKVPPPTIEINLAQPIIETFELQKMSESDLLNLSNSRLLALNALELRIFSNNFLDKLALKTRAKVGLTNPTDCELEAFAQTQSEHCKHKIFNAKIKYDGKIIDSLYATYIKGATKKIAKAGLLSVFSDNAGIIDFDSKNAICLKVETHNSPSALDPFGGAETGIVGVNRDILGAGIGAKPIANMDVFCLPPYNSSTYAKFLYEGVRNGVASGGNKSGIPTINGAYVFDESYNAKPLVFCGTLGIMPKIIGKRKSWQKKAMPNDLILSVGGRVGKDGIHGATFSSEGISSKSPTSAVQIGDPITQKKMTDMILEARDLSLYNSITDCGAGGLSSAVGEMAIQSGGCEIHLDLVPLKYPGLMPWEILVSESQERMIISLPKKNLKKFNLLCKKFDVEATSIGKFTKSGFFHVLHKKKTAAYLDLNFLHNGLPKMELDAKIEVKQYKKTNFKEKLNYTEDLKKLLSHPDICSKEETIRRYDHEVKGLSVIKALCGKRNDGPNDAAVITPVIGSNIGISLSNGICPKYDDPKLMAQLAVDEAIRNAVCVGANPNSIYLLDNFCWPDPIESKNNPDGKKKLGDLILANIGLYESAISYSAPFISGKDSMKNDKILDNGQKISIKPTILITALGIVEDVNKCLTSDFKEPGNNIAIIGNTDSEMGKSHFLIMNSQESELPKIQSDIAIKNYEKLHKAILEGLIYSAHDVSEGGIAVAISEMCIGGKLGANIDLSNIPGSAKASYEKLFSETPSRIIVSYPIKNEKRIKEIIPICDIGKTQTNQTLNFMVNFETIISSSIIDLENSFKGVLN